MKKLLLILFSILLMNFAYSQGKTIDPSEIKFTILYNERPLNGSFIGDQGFSCFIEIGSKSYLFDAGNIPDILKKNSEKMKPDYSKTEFIFISHLHTDHICGLSGIIENFNKPELFIPIEFPKTQTPKAKGYVEKTLADAEKIVSKITKIGDFTKIGDYFYSTGKLEDKTYEQSLIINSSKGLIILVGCSHSGIVEIVKHAKEKTGKKVYLVMGGFHLLGERDPEKVKLIADELKNHTELLSAGHCNDDAAIEIFKTVFKDKFVDIKTGEVLCLSNFYKK